jgi:BolA protein
MLATELESRLRSAFSPATLTLLNESNRHNVPPGSETHFKVTLVSESFTGQPRVRRHQMVYAQVQDLLDGPLHALALHLHTPEEWAKQSDVPASPPCRGGEQ